MEAVSTGPADPAHDLDLFRFLHADPQPTFVVPINANEHVAFDIVFSNYALEILEGFHDKLNDEGHGSTRFKAWVMAVANWSEQHDFADHVWTAFSVERRWKVVRAQHRKVPRSNTSQKSSRKASLEAAHEEMMRNWKDSRLESYQTMMEMSEVGVFEYDTSGTLIRANESWYRLSRHPKELDSHTDFSFMDLVYHEDIPLVMSTWNKLLEGSPITFEMRWKGPKNDVLQLDQEEPQWVLSACLPILENGTVVSITGNTIDIGAQKRVQEEALQRAEALERARVSELQFKTFAELAPVAIYIFDATKGMQYCNNQLFEFTGHEKVDPKEVDWENLVHPDDIEIVSSAWIQLLDEKRRTQAQFRLRKTVIDSNGVVRHAWAQGQSHPECDSNGNVLTILGTLTDITSLKLAEEIQQTRVKEALESKRQQENFIDMTSHEMRNPLSAVVQCSDSSMDALNQISYLIENNSITTSAKMVEEIQTEITNAQDAIQTIISCALHQKRIIDDILTLSKLDSDLILITPILVQPVKVVKESIKIFEVECSKEGIDLSFCEDKSLAETGVDWVMLDPSRILQILLNLLTNAIKFSHGRPVKKIKVTFGASETGLGKTWNGITFADARNIGQDILDKEEWGTGKKVFLWITVEDTGCGISRSEQQNLFTRFSQATPRTHVQYGGSGLGLFISKSLTELQNGRIGVKSETNVGSTFAFFVGTRIAESSELESQEQTGTGMPNRNKSSENILKSNHYSVLIVEDNIVNQTVLSRQLQKLGCIVYTAGHGQEALEFLKTTKFWHTQTKTGLDLSIVLMDVEMPVMDGLTCTKKIRELQTTGNIIKPVPILAVSANARMEQISKALEAGMDDSIAKPFRIPELIPKIEKLARR